MIEDLQITDLGVIDQATIELHPGLTAVTGETGAGKTMIVTGLGLLLGERADQGVVRRGADKARVEGVFAQLPGGVRERVADLGGDLDDETLIIARHIGGGRSRCFVGGAGVPAGLCAEVAEQLITIHGQSEQVRLSAPDRQREILDRYAGADAARLLAAYTENWMSRRQAQTELDELVAQSQQRAREIDLLTFGLSEIEQIDPQPGEDRALAAEAVKLQAVDDLRRHTGEALTALAGTAEELDSPSAVAFSTTARKSLAKVAEDDEAARELAARAAEISYLVADLSADLAGYLDNLEADPARLEWIAERRAALQSLTRKYGDTVDEVLAWSAEASRRLTGLNSSDDRIETLRATVDALTFQIGSHAQELTDIRVGAAKRLADAVRGELAALAMPHARLEFAITPLPEPGAHGGDHIVLQFSANPGSEPRALGKIASGGELSRIRLALEVVLAAADRGRTFVFDEVDAGVGGKVAVEIGRRLARLAEHSQVIVVTHLAQVAAFADRHFVVVKSSDGEVTTSGVRRVTASDRAAELARMMGGIEASDSAMAHASELLSEAGRGHSA